MMTTPRDAPVAKGQWPFSACPDCGGHDFASIEDHETVVFTCLGCATSWRYLLGFLVSVPAVPTAPAVPMAPAVPA